MSGCEASAPDEPVQVEDRGRRRDGGFRGARLECQELNLANEVVPAAGQPLWHPTLTRCQRTSLGHLADALIFHSSFGLLRCDRSVCVIVYGRATVAAAIAYSCAQS
jgi:hypothetical protein